MRIYTVTCDGQPAAVVRAEDPAEAVAIARELNLPIRFVGTGEQMDDLVPFDAQTYVNSLFD